MIWYNPLTGKNAIDNLKNRKGSHKEVSKMINSRKIIRGLAQALVVSLVAGTLGCATWGGPPESKVSRDWYDDGVRLTEKKRYQEAAESLGKALTLHRDAALDASIHIALGDANFMSKNYEEAIETYREFLRIHPRNGRSDYALFKIGMSYFKQMRSKDRSQEPTRHALEAFEKILRNYSRSELVEEAGKKVVACRKRLAEHELYVGRYYLRTKSYVAALPRFDKVYQEYVDIGFGDDALYYLGLCYWKLEKSIEAKEAWDLLVKDYPFSPFRKQLADREG